MSPLGRRWFDRAALMGAVLLYAVSAARELTVPIPGYDEAIYAPPALAILRGAAGEHLRRWPLMVMPYVGCPMSYVLAACIKVWGLNVYTLRLPAMALALAAVLILVYLASRIFPRLPPWAPALVCLSNSAFMISSRKGLYVDASIHWLLLSSILLCLWQWRRKRRTLHAFLIFLLCGFGIYSKIIFVWFLFPAAAGVWAFAREDDRSGRWRLAGLCALGLVLGALPLLIFNATNGGATIRIILRNWLYPEDPTTASNAALFTNLITRHRHLILQFSGDYLYSASISRKLAGTAELLLFFAGFILARKRAQRTALACAAAFVGALFLGSMFTISGRFPEHLYPILPLMLVLSGISLARLLPNRLALLAACVLLLLPQRRHFDDYIAGHKAATNHLSIRALSSLSEYLVREQIARPIALEWGIINPLVVASGGRVNGVEDDGDPPQMLPPGSVALCYWHNDIRDEPPHGGCGTLLRNPSFVLGDILKFPPEPAAPVYAVIKVRDVR